MYSINNIRLDNPTLGWKLMAPTEPLSALQVRRTVTERSGRDGVFSGPASRGPVTLKFVVRTPKANREALLALFASGVLEVREVGAAARVAYGELLSSTPEKHYPKADIYEDAFLVRIPQGCWRGNQITTPVIDIGRQVTTFELFDGLSAPVQDAIVRIRGPVYIVSVIDSSGSRFWYGSTIPEGRYLRFHSDTSRSWITDTDTWSGGTEVSGAIGMNGPRDVFEITPRFPTPSDPRVRNAQITVDWDYPDMPASGAQIQVRGRPAYLF